MFLIRWGLYHSAYVSLWRSEGMWWSQLSPSIIWVLEIEFKLSGVAASWAFSRWAVALAIIIGLLFILPNRNTLMLIEHCTQIPLHNSSEPLHANSMNLV